MKKIISIFIIFLFHNSFGCDCSIISKEAEFQDSNFVFIGKVTFVDSDFIFVNGLESFKGKLIDNIKIKIDYCSIYPLKGELWLIYMTKTKNQYSVSSCGNSRSFNKPFNKNSLNFPKPPPIGISKEVLNLITEKDFKISNLELEYDINTLRLVKTKNDEKAVDSQNKNLKSQIKYLKGFTFFIILITIIFFTYKKIMNKK